MERLLEEFVREICEQRIDEVKPGALRSATTQKIIDRSSGRYPKLSLVDKKRKIWHYTVEGGKKNYTVKIRVQGSLPKKGAGADIDVTCNCPFFRWQGPEHWAKVGNYLYGAPVGTATFPGVMDPGKNHPICKHAVAALGQFERAYIS